MTYQDVLSAKPESVASAPILILIFLIPVYFILITLFIKYKKKQGGEGKRC